MPKLAPQPQPPSPDNSGQATAGKEATAVLLIGVNDKGSVDCAKVIRSVGHGLDEKAIEAVQQWLFTPATQNGHPVPVQVKVEIKFRIY